MARALYICYFGLRQPLVQTQVLPYLRELRKDGHEIGLLTFEPDLSSAWTSEQLTEMQEAMQSEGLTWHYLAYHKRFSALATAYDVFRGAWKVRELIKAKQLDILHGRVHVPTLMGALARKFSRRKPKLLFDIRGFFPEEYTEAGIWPTNGIVYRTVKRIEQWLMKESDGFVVLTETAREILFPESTATGLDKEGRPVEVIPCCVDLDKRFSGLGQMTRDKIRRRLRVENRFVITHVGALGGLYLSEEIADLIATARQNDPAVFALLLTQSDPDKMVALLHERGFSPDDYFVGRVQSSEVPQYLSASDLGISFVKASYATLSRSPTKIPEYLAAGLPIISNSGVGDVDKLIATSRVGALVDSFDNHRYLNALQQVAELRDSSDFCRMIARQEFDLELVGGARYRRLYARLMEYDSE